MYLYSLQIKGDSNKQRCVNDGVTKRTGHNTDGNVWYGQVSHRVLCSTRHKAFTFGEHARKPKMKKAWFQQWNTGEVLWWFGQQCCGNVVMWSHYYPSGATQYPDVILEQRWSFPWRQFPATQLGVFSRGLDSMQVKPLAGTITKFEHHWTNPVTFGD
jgi:hypothetical protein